MSLLSLEAAESHTRLAQVNLIVLPHFFMLL